MSGMMRPRAGPMEADVDMLLAGYRRFRAGSWLQQRRRFEELADQGQQPQALVLGCVDSRADPALIFDAVPGQMLTVRNVANLVPPYAPDVACHGTSAALEFAVRILQVPHIVVLGHGLCGGVRVLLEGAPREVQDFVAPWMSMAASVRERVMPCTHPPERQQRAELEIVKLSLANLMTFPWIAERVAAGSLRMHGAWFAIRSGELMLLQSDGSFQAAS
jgi:carbonic anhydrase